MLTHSEISDFNKYGFLIKRMFVTESYLDDMQNVAINHLENLMNPIEIEVDLNYLGASPSLFTVAITTSLSGLDFN